MEWIDLAEEKQNVRSNRHSLMAHPQEERVALWAFGVVCVLVLCLSLAVRCTGDPSPCKPQPRATVACSPRSRRTRRPRQWRQRSVRVHVEVADSVEGWRILAQERLARAQAAEQAHLQVDRELLHAQEQNELLGRERRDLMDQLARAIQESVARENERDTSRSAARVLAEQRRLMAEAGSEALGILEQVIRQEVIGRGELPRVMELLRRALRGLPPTQPQDEPRIVALGTYQHRNGYDACADHATPPGSHT